MLAAYTAVSLLLAAALGYAAARKLSHEPGVVGSYARVGVPEERLDLLALILIGGAGGLLAGVLWPPIGIAAATGLVAYFLLALAAHVRAEDLENLPTPVAMELLAVTALVLRLASA